MKATDDLKVVGRITSPYGLKGWVKVYSYTDPTENIFSFSNWSIVDGSGVKHLELAAGKQHGPGLVAQIRGVNDREQACLICGHDILVPVTEFPALPDGEFYWHQLEGLLVRSGEILLGRVSHLLETGSNDVVVVKPCVGSLDGRERLIPYLPGQHVKKVDLVAGEMLVDWDPEF